MQASMTIISAQQWGRQQLATSPSPADDVRRLLCHVLQQSVSYLMTWPERLLTESQWHCYQHLITQRVTGRPVAYLTGEQGFWDLTLEVSADTLIPRSESELLVELILDKINGNKSDILDLGTGTGAIALAIASGCSASCVTGVDFKQRIVDLAKRNAKRNGVTNCDFIVSNWFQSVPAKQYQVIVSNPPYVEPDSPYLQQGDLRHEPLSALTAADNGLADIKTIVSQARDYLSEDGWLYIEHGYQQKSVIRALFSEAGFKHIECVKDYAGLDRITLAQWQPK